MMRARSLWMGLWLVLALVAAGCSRVAPGSWPGVTPGQDTIWVAYRQQVYAVDAHTGTQKWAYPTKPDRNQQFFAPPRLIPQNNTLVVAGYDHVLRGLDPATGQERWTFTAAEDRYIAAPLLTDTALYAPNGDGTLYALDLRGQLRWTFRAEAALWAPPATDGERLYLASLDHNLYALDTATGQPVWQVHLTGALPATPTLVDGVLYVGELAPEVAAVQADDGAVLWTTSVEAWVWHSPVPLDEERLVVGDMGGHIYALQRADGRIVWQATVEGEVVGAPLVQEDTVFVATRAGYVVALDAAKGTIRWQRLVSEKAAIEAGPLWSADGILLIAPSDPKQPLLALRPEDGSPVWTFVPAD